MLYNNTIKGKNMEISITKIALDFAHSVVELSNAMSPYILFGLIFAGILHELVPQSLVTKHLGKGNISSVLKATFFGIPLPVCSCGVIPLAAGIKKSGASKGSTLSFLISTPITGVDSVLATYGIFGWIFTLYRLFTSMVIAIVAGVFTNIFDKDEVSEPKFSLQKGQNMTNLSIKSFAEATTQKEQKEEDLRLKFKEFSIKKALRYSFVNLLGDIAKPLFWGLLLGAAISVAIPQNLSDLLVNYPMLSYIIAISIAVPMYVCATASLPIAASLMLSGVSAGAAFVFLSAGPATNIVTIGVVKKMLGKKSVYIYLGSIIAGSLLFGLGLDYIFGISSIDPKSIVKIDDEYGYISLVSTILLWTSILYFFIAPRMRRILL